MEIIDKKNWKKGLKKNKDPYGARIYSYAEDWADLMEARMEKGEALEDIAKETSHEADTDGISGFMYGASINVLSWAWKHGDSLRRWHNLDWQVGNEGEKANKDGGVLNPAIITIGV